MAIDTEKRYNKKSWKIGEIPGNCEHVVVVGGGGGTWYGWWDGCVGGDSFCALLDRREGCREDDISLFVFYFVFHFQLSIIVMVDGVVVVVVVDTKKHVVENVGTRTRCFSIEAERNPDAYFFCDF